MNWTKWNGEDVGDCYYGVVLYLKAYYDGATYYSIFPKAYCQNGSWWVNDDRNSSGRPLETIMCRGTNKEIVPMYDQKRGDELFYTNFETPDGFPLPPSVFRKLPATGGLYMSEFRGEWKSNVGAIGLLPKE